MIGTPVLAGDPLIKRGYQVILHGDVLGSGAKDEVVVAAAILNSAVLIAIDGDMKRLVRRFGSPNNSEKYAKLNLISVSCDEVLASKRIAHAMTFIENEWSVACLKWARRMWVDIGPHRLTSYR